MLKALLICLGAVCLCAQAEAAYSRYSQQADQQVQFRELLLAIENIKHVLGNQEAELQALQQKSFTVDEIIDSLRAQQGSNLQTMRDSWKNQTVASESKSEALFAKQENHLKSLTQAIQQQSTEYAALFNDYRKRLIELEKTIEQQNQNIDNLQIALKSLTDALVKEQNKEIAEANFYRVKSGDSLEKIARNHQTSIKKLKELNALTSDQIIIGQKLQLPAATSQ